MKLGVLGATGRMGRLVLEEAASDPSITPCAAVSRTAGVPLWGGQTRALGPGVFGGCDVVIDFSLPTALADALPHLQGIPLVSGTTGLDPVVESALLHHAEAAPLLWAANFSLGVNLLLELVKRATTALPDFDVEIVELHHRAKRDAPSGTARSLAEAAEAGRGPLLRVDGRSGLVGARPRGELGVHAVRGGDVVGEHTVHLLGDGERVWLGHAASSRRTFARGALRAARWLAGRPPGRFHMADLLGDAIGDGPPTP